MSSNPFTGSWLRNAMKLKYPYKKDFEIAAMLGVSPQAFANWGRNDGIVRLPNAETLYLGYKALGMIDPDALKDPMTKQRFNGPVDWPVRGLAAADNSSDSRVPDTDIPGESVQSPPGMVLVPVQGTSMAPMVLSGQYVIIDRNREGFEKNGGVVVATILDPDWERREKMPGTFVKRCFAGDGFYYFTSIDSATPPFSAWREHCRIWPVLGIWLSENGRGNPFANRPAMV